MDFETVREFSTNLRRLARRADNACYDRQEILEAIVKMAEGYEEVADGIELKKIVQMQRDWVEAN